MDLIERASNGYRKPTTLRNHAKLYMDAHFSIWHERRAAWEEREEPALDNENLSAHHHRRARNIRNYDVDTRGYCEIPRHADGTVNDYAVVSTLPGKTQERDEVVNSRSRCSVIHRRRGILPLPIS